MDDESQNDKLLSAPRAVFVDKVDGSAMRIGVQQMWVCGANESEWHSLNSDQIAIRPYNNYL